MMSVRMESSVKCFELMKRILIIVAVTHVLIACSKKVLIPSCLQDKIATYAKDSIPFVYQVDVYEFKGKKVYKLIENPKNHTDAGAAIIDEDCSQICYLGGIAGLVLCDSENFEQNAKKVKTVWKK